MARKLAAIAFSLGCLHAGSVLALGLGDVQLESFLNEPLRASVDLLNMGGLHEDEIKIRLATTEDFDKLGVERNFFLSNITFNVVADGHGGARILISSEEPVLEPYLDFIVEARWPSGRLIREYTVLVDPQVFSQATPVVSASQRVEEVEGIPPPAKKNGAPAASGAAQSEDDDTIGAWGAEAGAGSGTRVTMRGSDLAPGEMPQRGYNAATSGSPTAGSRYMVSRDQTLWDIANRAKPAGASVHQTMLDIQRLNPNAFINGNINRIKAGYIIYLPSAADISSGNEATALSEVSQQNQAWREGRDGEAAATSRPKLTISAESEEIPDTAPSNKVAAGSTEPATPAQSPPNNAAATVKPAVPGGDTETRLAALEQQLQALQRIVTLKDDQIAALQATLVKSGGTVEVDPNAAPVVGETLPVPITENTVPAEEAQITGTGTATEPAPAVEEAPVTESTAKTAPSTVETPAIASKVKTPASKKKPPGPPEPAPGSSWASYLPYILGALVLAIGGFLLTRRRKVDDENLSPARQAASKEDVFSVVRLQEQNLVVKPVSEDTETFQPAPSPRDNRGYGERKHDEYASDVDSADALAEADIYIAYGRHQQAVDLLNNALANEPGNPVYHLKLIEIYTDRKNRVAAATQMEKLQAIGDRESLARAESLMANLAMREEPELSKSSTHKSRSDGPGLSPNPLAMMNDSNDALEADFSGLEIEGAEASDDDDLDLSSDFAAADSRHFEDEELVIAADSNGLSTKLDLARAYLDMGDDDGARQILNEVVAEGSDDLQAEARALLHRIGG